jgi:hypothetical protein
MTQKNILQTNLCSLLLILALNGCSPKMSESVYNEQAGLNGSFEHTEQGTPVNWLLYTSKTTGSGSFETILDSIEPKDGKYSFTWNVMSCDGRGGRYSPGMAQEIAAETGKTYRVSFWVRNNGTNYIIKLNAVSAFNTAPGPLHQSNQNTAGWRLYSYDYTIPKGMEKLRFELNVLSPGTLSIDDIRIEKI